MKSSLKDSELLAFMLLYAKHYLASGGPTSRLEEGLSRVGALHGKSAEVYATPTGVFVTLNDVSGAQDAKTALMRIRESGTNLGQLCNIERIFADLMRGKISLHAAHEALESKLLGRDFYQPWQTAFAAFLAGFAISFGVYQRLPAAFVSGFITAVIWALNHQFLKRRIANVIFSDFLSAFLTLVLAGTAHALLAPVSLEAYALGGIVMLVPGLALTTAIAELAEQNLVSGTAKFMQATLALLALGLAYLIFQQLSFSLDLRAAMQPATAKSVSALISAICAMVNVFCFGVIFKVPPKAILWSTLTGMGGWVCLQLLTGTGAASAAPFLASVVVGLTSLAFGQIFLLPSQVFSVPGIIGMLPGMLALTSFRYFASGDEETGVAFTFQVAITAVSIVFGLMTARLPLLLGIWDRMASFAKRE